LADNLTMSSAHIFVPYYDSVAGATKYTDINMGFLADNTQSIDDSAGWVGLFSWLNKLNPDWNKIRQTITKSSGSLSGEGFIQVVDTSSVNVLINTPGPFVDYWWKSSRIAKFGVIAIAQGLEFLSDICYVNSDNQYFEFDIPQSNNIYYNFQPGVVATIVANYPDSSQPRASPQIPPVYASALNYFGTFPLPVNQTPAGYIGPEVLP
jgi:hypothetical protein